MNLRCRSRPRGLDDSAVMEDGRSGATGRCTGVERSKVGSYALCVTAEASIWIQDAGAQQVELRASVHLSLEELQSVDLAFELPAAPKRREDSGNHHVLAPDPRLALVLWPCVTTRFPSSA